MPNWCSNRMEVTGPLNEQQRFLTAITQTDDEGRTFYRILESLLPMPEVLNGTQSPSPDSPEPHPNWAVSLANGEITQEWHDELVRERRARYDKAQEARAATGHVDWYSWQASNWGVKWGDSNVSVEANTDSLTVLFDTPWGPPTEGLERVSRLFPTLTFLLGCTEEGMAFIGAASFRNGEVEEASAEYPGCDEYDDDDDVAQQAAWDAQWEKAESRLTSLMESLR